MWYDVLPSLVIVAGCVVAPAYLVMLSNKLIYDNVHKRKVTTLNEAHCYLRDMRISGENNPYKQIGLGCTCKKPEPTAPCECKC